MSVQDLADVPADVELTTDVCIVGSGPAGTALAEELAGRTDVLVLESGGTGAGEADELSRIESVGAPRVMDQRLVRNRALGGSSATWWGRSATFDDTDLAVRPWVAFSGWPVERAALREHFARAARRLRLGVDDNLADERLRGRPGLRFDPELLEDYRWTYSRSSDDPEQPVRFGPAALELRDARVLVHATVTRLGTTSDGSRVTSLDVRGRDGAMRTVRARRVVLAAGGIENPRLLLASDSVDPRGIGNRQDQVGRYLMDHLRGPIGSYAPRDFVAVQRALGPYRLRTEDGAVRVVPGAALAPGVQREQGLLQAAVWVEGPIADDDAAVVVRRLRRRPSPGDVVRLARSAPLAAESVVRSRLLGRSSIRRRSSMELHCIVEQAPDPRSRITLGRERDAAGIPIAVIDWRYGDQEARTARGLAALFVAESRRRGLPVPSLDPLVRDEATPFRLPDVAHPTGGTRMSSGPSNGVVDVDCRVHGVDNLWIAGSSVFPTSGHANPTQTILALAYRLADQLSTR